MNRDPRQRLKKIIRNLTIDINTMEYWNKINPTETPLDVEDFRVMLNLARKCYASLTAGEYAKWSAEMAEYAETMAKHE